MNFNTACYILKVIYVTCKVLLKNEANNSELQQHWIHINDIHIMQLTNMLFFISKYIEIRYELFQCMIWLDVVCIEPK